MSGKESRIDIQFAKLESKKHNLMQRISALSTEEYLKKPSPNCWSVGQAANHIYLSERLSLVYLKKKLSYPDKVPPYHVKSWFALLLTKFTLRSPYKVKAPKAINMWEEQTIYTPQELETKWNTLRTDLISFIKMHEPSFGTHLAYNHPFAGRMTMHQMLIFFNDHMAHHIRQIEKIIKKLH